MPISIAIHRIQDYYQECENLINWAKENSKEDDFGYRRLKYLFDQLCFDACGKQQRSFSGLYARITFLADQYEWPIYIRSKFHLLRLELSADKLKDLNGVQFSFAQLLKLLVECIEFVSQEKCKNPQVLEFCSALADVMPKDTQPAMKQSSYLRLLCMENSKEKACILAEEPSTGVKLNIHLRDVLSDTATEVRGNGQLSMSMDGKQYFGRQFSIIAQLMDAGMIFHVFNLYVNREEKNTFHVGPNTVFVLEPDYLIDASDLAECFQSKQVNPYLYFLRLLSPSMMSKPALKGNIVNTALDQLLNKENTKADDLVRQSLMDQLFLAAQFGPAFEQEMKIDLMQLHWNNLQRFADYNRHKKIRIEPSFFSTHFGIQGRLDLMEEYEEDHYRKDIIELKSGKSPQRKAWRNNEYQVIAYQMLLSSCFDQKRKGSSSIFYSRATEDPIRDIPAYPANMQNLMMSRNLIIKVIRLIEQGAFNFSSLPARLQQYQIPPFAEKDLNRMYNLFCRMDHLQMTYFQVYMTFLFRELIVAKTGSLIDPQKQNKAFSTLWRESIKGKKEQYVIISDLRMKQYLSTEGKVYFEMAQKQISSFRKGDMILLYHYKDENDNPLNKEFFKGNIEEISAEHLVVSLRNKQCDHQVFDFEKKWAMEKDFYEKNIRSAFHSLFRFMDHHHSRGRKLVLGLEQPAVLEMDYECRDSRLMPSQRKVLEKIIKAKDYFLLQGPPGTGKTSAILLNLVKYQLEQYDSAILLLAFTNKAIDQICEKLEQSDIDFVRVNHSVERPDWSFKSRVKDLSFSDSIAEMKKAKVYVSTLASWQNKGQEILMLKKFDLLIVDEASQLTEPDLSGILLDFPKWVMIGDQNQLPAVVTQSEELCQVDLKCLNDIGIRDLRTSLFERLFKNALKKGWRHAIDQLTDHFRMHQEIAGLIKHWYLNGLNAALPVQQKALKWEIDMSLLGDFAVPLSSGRVVYCPTLTSDVYKSHPQEAQMVIAFLDVIFKAYGNEANHETVGVITPFRAQIAEINNLLKHKAYADLVSVDTVERYQGAEKDHILFSAAISSPLQLSAIESLSEDEQTDKKLNVALSRARKQFVLIGHEYSLKQSNHYAQVLNYCEERKLVFNMLPAIKE